MLSGTINGTFSGWETWKGIPFITWSATQSIAGNYSTIEVKLYFRRSSSYYSYNTSNHSNTSNVDGQTNYSADSDFDLRAGTGDYLIRTVSGIVVNHNADGSKTCWIGWSGNCNTSLGTYNFGETVTLDTIPREAYITTASVNFTVADMSPYTAIAFSLWNGGSYYVRARLYVGANLITTRQLGAVSSASFNLTDAENHALYALIPNATSAAFYWSIATFSDAGYSSQIGGNKDKAGTFYITDTYSKPTFTTYTIANVDEAIANTDKYGNVLITSNTNTLSGSSAKIISGYNKPRGTILDANKMTPLHSSTANKYRFASGSQYAEVATGAGDLTVDLNDVTANSFTMTAYDSRNYTTAAAGTVTSIVTPTAVNLYDLVLKRDNNVDALTKLQFSGNYWKSNFGSVDNAIVCQWRYKLTTESWAAQTWNTITPDDTDGALTFDDYIEGDLGAGGFDPDKSFNIEVRLYDKLTNIIVEGTISKGTPVVDFTQTGIAINGQYDSTTGGALQVNGDMSILENATLVDSYDAYTRTDMHRQAVMNGNFDVWQRGTTWSNPASTSYTADRWRYFVGADGGTLPTLITTARVAITAGALDGSRFCFENAQNGAGTSLGNNSYNLLAHYIENGTRFLCGAGKTLTLSFYAKTNSAGRKVGVYFTQGYGTGGSPTAGESIVGDSFTLTTSWKRYSVTINTNTTSGKTFGTNYDDNFAVVFVFQCGSGTFGTLIGNDTIPYGNSNVQIAQVQLNAGEVALPFYPKRYADELLDCQRYYFRISGYTDCLPTASQSTTSASAIITYPRPMRTLPVLSTSTISGSNFSIICNNNVQNITAINYGVATANYGSLTLTCSGGGLVSREAGMIRIQANHYIAFDAEL